MPKNRPNPSGSLYGKPAKNGAQAALLFPSLSRSHALKFQWRRGLFFGASQPNLYDAGTNPRGWNGQYSDGYSRLDVSGWVSVIPYVQRSVSQQGYDAFALWGGNGCQAETGSNWGCVSSPEHLRRYWTAPMLADWDDLKAELRSLGLPIILYSGLWNTPVIYRGGSYEAWNTTSAPNYAAAEWATAGNAEYAADQVARLRDDGDMDIFGMDAFYYVEAYRIDAALAFADRLCNHHGVPAFTEGPHAYDEVAASAKRAKMFRWYAEAGTVDGNGDTPAFYLPDGIARGGTSSTITLASGESSDNNAFANKLISIRSGAGAGQIRAVSSYNGTTKVLTVSEQWDVNPNSTSRYRIYSDVALDADYQVLVFPSARNTYIDQNAKGARRIVFGNQVWNTEQKATLRAAIAADPYLAEITLGVIDP